MQLQGPGYMHLSRIQQHQHHHHQQQQHQQQHQQQQGEQLSATNIYIKGLSGTCTDADLVRMCQQFGDILSTKAILYEKSNLCKGYGFVEFRNSNDAQAAVKSLQQNGVLAQFAKQRGIDSTNLYMTNLPQNYGEKDIEAMLQSFGTIASTRVLRDVNGVSRGVGFAR